MPGGSRLTVAFFHRLMGAFMTETRRATFLCLTALAAIVFAFYLPAISGRYVYLDDYQYFYNDQGPWYIEVLSSIGRPLTGLYLYACDLIIQATHSPDLAHLVGLVGVLLLCVATFGWLRVNAVRPVPAVLFCIIFVTLPSMLLAVTFINCGSYALAALFGLLALYAQAPALFRPETKLIWKIACYALSCLLLVIGFLFYQPWGLYYWTMTAVALVAAPCPDWKTFRSRVIPMIAVGITAMAVYTVVYKTFLYVPDTYYTRRGEMTHDYLGKIRWFWSEPLRNALALWNIPPLHKNFSGFVFGLCVSGAFVDLLGLIGLKAKGSLSDLDDAKTTRIGRLTLILAKWLTVFGLVPFSYVFNLVVVESWAAYRTTLPLVAIILVLAFASLMRWCSLLFVPVRMPTMVAITGVAAVLAMFHGGTNMMRLLILPRIEEFDFVKLTIAQGFEPGKHTSIHLIRADSYHGLAPALSYDEFGIPSTMVKGVSVPIVRKALQELRCWGPELPVTQEGPNDHLPVPAGAFVVDMREMIDLNPVMSRAFCSTGPAGRLARNKQ